MIKRLTVIISVALAALAGAAPLRVVVVSDVEAVRTQYGEILKKAGAQVGLAEVPTVAMLDKADAVLLHGRSFKALPDEAAKALSAFAARGGGIVAINGGIAAGDAAWGRSLLGGGWDPAKSGKFSSLMMLYVTPNSSPIVSGASSFDITDDTIYDLDLAEKLTVLGTAFTSKGREGKGGKDGKDGERASIYDIQPQMWTFESDKHRAAVLLPGADETLAHASMRTFILRSLAWTAKREKMDELVTPADIVDLRYPAGGPMRAAKAIQQFQMQPGFTATVIAEEPLINKPIAIQWDAKGQLWVAETPEYPNGRRPLVSEPWKETGVLEPGQYDRPGRDRICRLVDTNGDGQMDSKVVFYEGLELVTGFQVYGDGVIVVAQPNIVYLADTDGDGKADLEKPLFGGFTPGDTHFVTNNFILAPDGWIYASTGSGAGARDPQTKKDVAKISPGVFRFRPDGSAIEQVASQGGNTFGCEVTSDMEIFHGKATSGQPVQHVVLPEWVIAKAPGFDVRSMNSVNPGRTVARADLPKRAPIMQIDQVGRYSAACSVPVYEGGAWPEEYNGTIFMTEPILDIIHHERMVPKGASLEGKLVLENKEWLRSTDYWFSPITVTFGPDGAMYVLDFYTPVVTHNDTRGPKHSKSGGSVRPDRDHYFGRIYRIQHESAPKTPFPDMTKMDGPGLVATFKNANRLIRSTALRLLMEKQVALSTAALPALQTMAAGEKMTAARIQALWALQRFGHLDAPTFAKAAASEDASVRKNAMLIAEAGARELTAEQTKAALADSDERVRLAALRALGASPLSNANAAVLGSSLASLNNPWAEVAAAAAASSNPTGLLEGMLAAQGTGSSGPLRNVAKSLATSVARAGKAADITRLLKAAAASKDAALAAMVVQQLSANPVASPDTALVAAVKALLASPNRDLAAAALPLAAGMDGVKDEMAKTSAELAPLAQDASAPLERRVAAVRSLVAARGANPAVLRGMAAWLPDAKPAAFRKELISALAATGDPVVGEALVNNYASFDTDQRTIAFDAIVGRAEWCALWLDAMDKGKLAANLLDQRGVSRLTAHPDVATATRAKALFGRMAGGGSSSSKAKIIADLLPAVNKPGDAAKGKATFTAACMVCHQFQGAGQQFGPSLDGMGSHPASDLLTHIVDPSLVVDDEHRTWNITMKDGTQYSGLIGSENQTRIQLKQPGGAVLDLKPGDVATRKKADNSLMPEGFEALGADALRDLIAYLRSGDSKK
jgi:putative membrane-bound dehydrogenase-like protein